MEYTFEELLDAWDNYIEAKRILDKAGKEYDGYSPGWALQNEREDWEKSINHLKDKFNGYVTDLLREEMSEMRAIVFNLVKKLLGYHVCGPFTQWQHLKVDWTRLADWKEKALHGIDTVNYTEHYNERQCKKCGKTYRELLGEE